MARKLTYADIAPVLMYDETGQLFWRADRCRFKAGDRAGRINAQGYVVVQVNRTSLLGHRVVWLLTHGEWPENILDHKDGNPSNNRLSNLRPADNAQNQHNKRASNGRKYKGVTRLPHGRYQAQCADRYLGSFDTEIEAARAYDARASAQYGEYARLNFGGQP